MHIAQCLTNSGQGGGQQVVFTLVKNLLKYFPGLKLSVILPANGVYVDRFIALGVAVHQLPMNKLSLSSLFSVQKLLSNLNADIIHSHGKGAGFYSRSVSKSTIKAKRVHSYHGFHPPSSSLWKKLYLLQESYLLKNTDRLIMVSQSEAKEVASYFPLSHEKMKIISNVVECESTNDSLPGNLSEFLDSHKHSFIVTMVGRNDPVKNYPLAFAAMEQVLGTMKNIAFVVVGVSEHDHGIDELKKKFARNVIAIRELPSTSAIIERSSIVLMTSRKEGNPLTILEAFCKGKPVVGTNVGGIRDLVLDNMNGVLCQENSLSISQAIMRLSQEKETYDRLAAGALATAKDMDIAAWTRSYYTLYKELAS